MVTIRFWKISEKLLSFHIAVVLSQQFSMQVLETPAWHNDPLYFAVYQHGHFDSSNYGLWQYLHGSNMFQLCTFLTTVATMLFKNAPLLKRVGVQCPKESKSV